MSSRYYIRYSRDLSSNQKAGYAVATILVFVAFPTLFIMGTSMAWKWDVLIICAIYFVLYVMLLRHDWIRRLSRAIQAKYNRLELKTRQPQKPQPRLRRTSSDDDTEEIWPVSFPDANTDPKDDISDDYRWDPDPMDSTDNTDEMDIETVLRETLKVNRGILRSLRILVDQSEPKKVEFNYDPTLTPNFGSLPHWIRETIPENEFVVIFTRWSWVRAIPSVLMMALVTVAFGWFVVMQSTVQTDTILLSLFVWAVLMVWPVIDFLKYRRHAVAWTDVGIRRYRGILNIHRDFISYGKITDLTVTQPFLGRFAGYCNVVVETPGQKQAINVEKYLAGYKRKALYIERFVTTQIRD